MKLERRKLKKTLKRYRSQLMHFCSPKLVVENRAYRYRYHNLPKLQVFMKLIHRKIIYSSAFFTSFFAFFFFVKTFLCDSDSKAKKSCFVYKKLFVITGDAKMKRILSFNSKSSITCRFFFFCFLLFSNEQFIKFKKFL